MSELVISSETRCCRECGKPLPVNAPVRTKYCSNCLREHHKVSSKNYYRKNKDEIDAAAAETYHYFKDHGICVSCHRRDAFVLPDGSKSPRCKHCLELGQKAQRRMRRKKKKKA